MEPKDIVKNIKKFPKDKQLMKSMTLTAAILCCADGEVDESEVIKVKELGKKFFKDEFDPQDFDKTLKASRTLINFNTESGKEMMKITASLFKDENKISKDQKIQIYSFFSEIALADGIVDPNELSFLNLISENLEIENPFNYQTILKNRDANPRKSSQVNKEATDHIKEFQESITMLARMMIEAMISGGMIKKNQEVKALEVSLKVVAMNTNKAVKLLSKDQSEQAMAFLDLSDQIINEMGETNTNNKPQYSSTVYADTQEELLQKKRSVNIYASIGLLSIFGFIGSFGYALYLFFNSGNFVLWIIIGVILVFFQKWIGKKHDELTG